MTWLGVNSGRIGGEGAFFSLVPETSHDRVKLSLPERWRGSHVLTCLLLSKVGGHLGVMNMVGMAVFFFFLFQAYESKLIYTGPLQDPEGNVGRGRSIMCRMEAAPWRFPHQLVKQASQLLEPITSPRNFSLV